MEALCRYPEFLLAGEKGRRLFEIEQGDAESKGNSGELFQS